MLLKDSSNRASAEDRFSMDRWKEDEIRKIETNHPAKLFRSIFFDCFPFVHGNSSHPKSIGCLPLGRNQGHEAPNPNDT